ncbi:MAG TPA: M14 family metallopeptidase [Isosphaeraceae bacterium]|jgi:hypothetical protein
MAGASCFSPDYVTARARFRAAAAARGFRLEALPIAGTGAQGEELTVEVAATGSERPARVVVVSGGLHGVEGFLGSAVQAALLEEGLRDWSPPPGAAVVLLHALNPFGFSWLRRSDAENVDLNRNFLRTGEPYRGSPAKYAELDWLLNPTGPPGPRDLFLPRALLAIARHGFATLKQAIAGGQYDFPRGLFFGGHGPAALRGLLEARLPRWIGPAERVLHVDFHSGLGPWATHKLLVEHGMDPDRERWLAERFGAGAVERGDPNGISYRARGGLGDWCQAAFPDRHYDLVCAEFGTFGGLAMITALRAENQAHHWGDPADPTVRRAKRRLKDAFIPPDRRWRDAVVTQGLALVRRAIDACVTTP